MAVSKTGGGLSGRRTASAVKNPNAWRKGLAVASEALNTYASVSAGGSPSTPDYDEMFDEIDKSVAKRKLKRQQRRASMRSAKDEVKIR